MYRRGRVHVNTTYVSAAVFPEHHSQWGRLWSDPEHPSGGPVGGGLTAAKCRPVRVMHVGVMIVTLKNRSRDSRARLGSACFAVVLFTIDVGLLNFWDNPGFFLESQSGTGHACARACARTAPYDLLRQVGAA